LLKFLSITINKERSNAKHVLKPKKEHHGYIVLDSIQRSYNLRWDGKKLINREFVLLESVNIITLS